MHDALIERIERAFADVVYPGDDDLTDSYGDEPEALKCDFRGKTDWRTLDPAFIDQAPDGWGTALAFFSDRALLFYLPAYLIADLRDQLWQQDPTGRLCIYVTPQSEDQKISKFWGGGTMGERARACFSQFTAEQVQVIVDYLWWRLDADGYEDLIVRQALENYWLQRAEDESSPSQA